MASNLVRKGSRVVRVRRRTRRRLRALEALGAQPRRTCADVAAASDVVFTMLPTTAIVERGDRRARTACSRTARRGTTIVDMSTIDPLVTDRLAAAAAARASRLPTRRSAGSRATPSAASRSSWSAPTDDVFARIKPMLDTMGTTIHHCGGVGTGMRTKLVNNYLAIISCQLNAEAIALSQRFGLTLEKTLDVIHGTTATNGQLKIAWPSKVLKGDVDARLHDRPRAQGSDAHRRGRQRGEGAGADRGRRARGLQRRRAAAATAARISRPWSTCCATTRASRGRDFRSDLPTVGT